MPLGTLLIAKPLAAILIKNMKYQFHLLILFLSFLTIIFGCKKINGNSEIEIDTINIGELNLDTLTEIVTKLDGYHKIDANSIIPEYDSTLLDEYKSIRELIESRSNFKLKSDWDNGNDSPSNGIWIEYSSDTTKGFYAINTTEGHIGIYGSTKESIKNAISMFESLFPISSQNGQIRGEWYLPRIVIEHKENNK